MMMEMFCILTINVNILVLILYYNFARCYHWGKQGKRYRGFLCITSDKCMKIYNDVKLKYLMKEKHNLLMASSLKFRAFPWPFPTSFMSYLSPPDVSCCSHSGLFAVPAHVQQALTTGPLCLLFPCPGKFLHLAYSLYPPLCS